jgi:hypothetical protein
LGVAVHRIGRHLVSAAESDSIHVGLDAFLPVDEETAWLTRAWLACCELARSEPWLTDIAAELRARERMALAELPEGEVAPDRLDLVVATLDGLRAAVCAPGRPLSVDRARTVLRQAATGAPEGAS